MIKILKKLSFRFKGFFPSFLRHTENFFPLGIVFFSILAAFFYFFLPLDLTFREKIINPYLLIAFYSLSILMITLVIRRHLVVIARFEAQNQDLQEAINVLNSENAQENQITAALYEKNERYNTLQKIISEINQNLELDYITNSMSSIAFSLIGRNSGCCILYLAQSATQKLNLLKSRKEDKKLILKAKEGDIFDLWVLRHSAPLFIEDIRKDFRFDLEKLKAEETRTICSLVSSPIKTEQRFLGILRLDHPQNNFYSQDDVRFLVTICDICAFALENSELFERTQNLAIHDGLTLVYTKGYFLDRLKEECRRSLRQNRVLSLLMFDIDYFKNYNDKFGHTAGDILLRSLSQDMREFFEKKSGVVCRFGGEEFCVILPGVDKKEAFRLAQELRKKIQEKRIVLRRQQTSVTVSVGVASFSSDASDDVEFIIKVDRAMYDAKQKGRNRVVLA